MRVSSSEAESGDERATPAVRHVTRVAPHASRSRRVRRWRRWPSRPSRRYSRRRKARRKGERVTVVPLITVFAQTTTIRRLRTDVTRRRVLLRRRVQSAVVSVHTRRVKRTRRGHSFLWTICARIVEMIGEMFKYIAANPVSATATRETHASRLSSLCSACASRSPSSSLSSRISRRRSSGPPSERILRVRASDRIDGLF